MPDPFFEAAADVRRKRRKPAASAARPASRGRPPPERRRKRASGGGGGDDDDDDAVGAGAADDLDEDRDDDGGDYDDEADEAEQRETAAEKRLRLAKGYIASLKQNLGRSPLLAAAARERRVAHRLVVPLPVRTGDSGEYDAAEIDRDLIAERLKDDAVREFIGLSPECSLELPHGAAVFVLTRPALLPALLQLETAGRLHRNVAECYKFPQDPSGVRSVRASRGHQLPITCVAADESLSVLYTGSKDASIIKWDAKTGKKLHTFPGGRKGVKHFVGHTDHVLALAVSPDGRYLASGGRDRLINVWSVGDNRHVHTFRHHKDAVTGLAFRRATAQLYSCSLDRSVKLWDLDQMSYVETLFGHQDGVPCIDALARERAVTVGARDRTVRLWKIVEEAQLVFRGGGVGKRRGCGEVDGGKLARSAEGSNSSETPPGFLEGSIDVVSMIDEEHFLSGGDSGCVSQAGYF
ncbi:MAG: WD40-repeat-containing domain protein [Olpidium bornovanus]|uniref:WD40-repeat-containing domain protein n=1 Tax=Olpidium bornovanus TaxID=278681 RepID=A0A8H7ZMQ0_9FUNG|nr:MAG: WD40-repeat-containing domain protein [Olpidium bornovanus]